MGKNVGFVGYLIPSMRDVIFVSTFLGVILIGPRTLNIDGDLGRHLTIGNYTINNFVIPTQDIFSHTMLGQPLTPHEWLAQVFLALSNLSLGLDGVVLLEALVVAGTFVIVFRDTLKRSNSILIAAMLTIWAAAASSLHWIARPHIFTFLLIALWTPVIRKIANGDSKYIWAPPLIMLIWANTHGAFISGFVILACFLAGWFYEYYFTHDKPSPKILKNLLLISGISFAVTLINPVGLDLWSTSVGYIQNDYLVSHTQEYFSPNFHLSGTLPFLVLISFSIFILSMGLKKLSFAEGLLVAGWTAMALYSARNIPIYAIVAAPILGDYLSNSPARIPAFAKIDSNIRNIETQLRGFLWPFAATVFVVIIFTQGRVLDAAKLENNYSSNIFPVEAVNWLEDNPQTGNMFNYFTWGGYLLYRLWPSQPVFIDGQTDFYGEELTREYASSISGDPLWSEVFRKYQIRWAIIPKDVPLLSKLVSAGWDILYEDETAILLRMP